MHYPEKKGYSARNLAYMCQFARTFSVEVLQKMLSCDVKLKKPTIDNVQSATRILDNLQFVQEVPAQIKEIGRTISFMLQTSIGEIERGCVKTLTQPFFYAQSPDFLKPGLCYYPKFSYL